MLQLRKMMAEDTLSVREGRKPFFTAREKREEEGNSNANSANQEKLN